MRSFLYLICIFWFISFQPGFAQTDSLFKASQTTDSIIKTCMNEINADSIKSYMQSLQDMGTRYAFADNRREVAQWIANKFKSFGYEDAHLDSFLYSYSSIYPPIFQYNVSCTRNGIENSSPQIIIGAHHDAVEVSPGADDNGSGTAGVLELARVFATKNIKTNHQLKFITFAAEEIGLIGSKYDANETIFQNQPTALMLNMDMISNSGTDSLALVHVNYKPSDNFLSSISSNAGKYYSGMTSVYDGYPSNSDHYSYGEKGVPVLYFEEYEFSPVYHTKNDLVINTNSIYASRVLKTVAASLLIFDWFPQPAKIQYTNSGNGSSVKVSWQKYDEKDTYHLLLFSSNSILINNEATSDTTMNLEKLVAGENYQVIVTTTNNPGNTIGSSGSIVIPDSIPQSPEGLKILGLNSSFQFEWEPNPEEDILGYNLYENFTDGSPSAKVNTSIIPQTNYTDGQITDNDYHYFRVTAVDQNGNESGYSNLVSSKLGKDVQETDSTELLVIVDISSIPSLKEQLTHFFEITLAGQSYSLITLLSNQTLDINRVLMSKRVIWATPILKPENNAYELNYPILISYLKSGGKLLLSTGNANVTTSFFDRSLPSNIPELNSSFEYLKTQTIDYKFDSWFNGAKSNSDGYPDLDLNPESVPTTHLTNSNLKWVQSIVPSSQSKVIYTYNSPLPNEPNRGQMQGSPVGLEYLGSDFDLVFLSFPVVFMKPDQAKELFSYVLDTRFNNQTTAIGKNNELSSQTISLWPVPADEHLYLSVPRQQKSCMVNIYSSLGQLCFSVELAAQNHFLSIDISKWKIGLYVVSMAQDGQSITKKIMVFHE